MVDDDALLSAEQIAKKLHVEPQTLATWRCLGKGPPFVKVGRAVFYRASAISSWLKAQERDPATKQRAA